MANVIVVQRLVAHYRLPVFRRLWDDLGWRVVTSRKPPGSTYLSLFDNADAFLLRYDFAFPDPANMYRCNIPVDRILEDTGADAVLAEFSMHINATYRLPWLRRTGRLGFLAFWGHGYNMERGLHGVRQQTVEAIRLLPTLFADAYLNYSEEGRDFLARFVRRERLFVAPNTLDIAPMQALAETVTPEPAPGWPHLINVGRITEDKAMPRLIAILRQLREHFPDAALTLVGDGPDAEAVRQAAGDDLGRAVRMPGAIYDEQQLAAYYRSADLAVFTGAVGLSVNHALAYGVPVVAFDRTPAGPHHHPEIAYVIDDVTGLRVAPYTDAGMVAALTRFLECYPDPKTAFRERIRDYSAQSMSLDRMIGGFKDLDGYINRRLARVA